MSKITIELEWDETKGTLDEECLNAVLFGNNMLEKGGKYGATMRIISSGEARFPMLASIFKSVKADEEKREPIEVAGDLSLEELYGAVIRAWAMVTTEEYSGLMPDEVSWSMVCNALHNRRTS